MPLTATAWTLVVLPTDATPSMGPTPGKYRISEKTRITRVRAELTNASNGAAYPTSGGIPLPSFNPTGTPVADWGMIRNLDYVVFQGVGHTASGLATAVPVWQYNPTAHAILGFRALASNVSTDQGLRELATTWTPTLAPFNTVFFFEAKGW